MTMNYNLKIDFAKLNKVGVARIKGQTGEKVQCVVIPVEENGIFLSDKGGIYKDFTAIELKEERYGQSHLVKPSVPSEVYKYMTEEEKKSVPICGSLVPIKAKNVEVTKEAEVDENDDLPF